MPSVSLRPQTREEHKASAAFMGAILVFGFSLRSLRLRGKNYKLLG